MNKSLPYILAKWIWDVFVGCSVAFFLYYLVNGEVFNIKSLTCTGIALSLTGSVYHIYLWRKQGDSGELCQ